MRKLKLTLTLLALAVLASPAIAQTDLPSAKEVLKKYVEATGGTEAYKAVKTMAAEAEISIPAAGVAGTMEMKMELPDKLSVIASLPGIGDQLAGANGKYTWNSSAMTGARLVEGSEAEQLKQELEFTRYTDPENYYKEMTNTGVEEVDGTKAYKLELVRKSGTKQTEYYAVESGLLVRSVVKTEVAGMGEIEIVTKLDDYQKTGKFKVPFKMTQVLPNNMEQIIKFSKYEYNVKLDGDTFAPPEEVQKLIDKKEESSGDGQ